MDLLTIGTFAALTRLSPKALRLYAELGLLLPAHVDPVTGYRFYARTQLEPARLVAWLRRLGMPLAQIRTLCELEPSAAAQAVQRFWAQVEAETVARRDLAAFLIDELSASPAQAAVPAAADRLEIRYAVRSDVGLVRQQNQDAAYAGTGLIAVADGFGTGGERAGTAAINALRALALDPDPSAGELLNALHDAVGRANHAIGELPEPTFPESTSHTCGTTLTAMVWAGSRVALVHIGDSRAYLRRDQQLFQITHDHTLVQAMVDDGRLSPAEGASHPQRALLLRALDGRAGPAADVRLHEARPGDRYLLCSDGLSAVVAAPEVSRVLDTVADPEQVVRELVELARAAGAPDNVSCVVADVTGARTPDRAGC